MKLKFKLHWRQQQVIDDFFKIYERFPNDQKGFIEMPTGTGKTVVALSSIDTLYEGFNLKPIKVVWTSYQKNLISQAFESLKDNFFSEDAETGSVGNNSIFRAQFLLC